MAPLPPVSSANLPEEVSRWQSFFFSDEAKLHKITQAFRQEFGQGQSALACSAPAAVLHATRTDSLLGSLFLSVLETGLDSYGQDVAMIPSFVTGVPDGSEQGSVPSCTHHSRASVADQWCRLLLSVEPSLRSTLEEPTCMSAFSSAPRSFRADVSELPLFSRVCEVKLEGSNKFTIKQQKYKVSDALKQGDARDLFGASVLVRLRALRRHLGLHLSELSSRRSFTLSRLHRGER